MPHHHHHGRRVLLVLLWLGLVVGALVLIVALSVTNSVRSGKVPPWLAACVWAVVDVPGWRRALTAYDALPGTGVVGRERKDGGEEAEWRTTVRRCAILSFLAYFEPSDVAAATDALVGRWGGDTIRSLLGATEPPVFLTSGDTTRDAQAYLWVMPDNACYVAFRGTKGMHDWALTNADQRFVTVSVDGRPCRVHRGFLRQFGALHHPLAAALRGRTSVVFTGHSLGGALAAIAAAFLGGHLTTASCYTFGAPRAGDAAFARQHRAVVPSARNGRVFRPDDPIPALPTDARYVHVPGGVSLPHWQRTVLDDDTAVLGDVTLVGWLPRGVGRVLLPFVIGVQDEENGPVVAHSMELYLEDILL